MTGSSSPWVLGVDPGAQATGIVVRTGDELAYGTTAVRDKGETVELYAAGVVHLVAGIKERFIELLDGRPLVAIEAVLAPSVWNNGERVVLHPQFVMDTCTVAGHIAGWATAQRLEVEWVRPGHNGQGFIGSYPAAAAPDPRQGAGKDRLRHLRSAWDVAGAAMEAIACPATMKNRYDRPFPPSSAASTTDRQPFGLPFRADAVIGWKCWSTQTHAALRDHGTRAGRAGGHLQRAPEPLKVSEVTRSGRPYAQLGSWRDRASPSSNTPDRRTSLNSDVIFRRLRQADSRWQSPTVKTKTGRGAGRKGQIAPAPRDQ